MLHRHLNQQRYTLAAIDDVILRGQWKDWADLRRAVLMDRSLLDKVERVCRPYVSDPYDGVCKLPTSHCLIIPIAIPQSAQQFVPGQAGRL